MRRICANIFFAQLRQNLRRPGSLRLKKSLYCASYKGFPAAGNTRQSTFESQSPSPSPQRLFMLQQVLPPVHIFTRIFIVFLRENTLLLNISLLSCLSLLARMSLAMSLAVAWSVENAAAAAPTRKDKAKSSKSLKWNIVEEVLQIRVTLFGLHPT